MPTDRAEFRLHDAPPAGLAGNANFGRASTDAVDGLLRALHDTEPRVRSASAIALKFVAIERPEHQRSLAVEAAEHSDESVRSQREAAARHDIGERDGAPPVSTLAWRSSSKRISNTTLTPRNRPAVHDRAW